MYKYPSFSFSIVDQIIILFLPSLHIPFGWQSLLFFFFFKKDFCNGKAISFDLKLCDCGQVLLSLFLFCVTLLLSNFWSSLMDWDTWKNLDLATQIVMLEVYQWNPFKKKMGIQQVSLSSDSSNKIVNDNQFWPLGNIGRVIERPGSFSTEAKSSVPFHSKVHIYYSQESSFELDWIQSSIKKSTLRK